MLALVVRNERLQPADSHRLPVLARHATAFAEPLLGTEATAHLRHGTRLAELVRRPDHVALFQQGEGSGDIVAQRARLAAAGRRALDAAACFYPRCLQVEGKIHLVPVVYSRLRRLLGHGLGWYLEARLAVERRLRLLLCHSEALPGGFGSGG